MINLKSLNKTEIGAELGVLLALDEQVEEKGYHFTINPRTLGQALGISDSTVRRTLKKFAELDIIKINNEIWVNPAVFEGGIFEKIAYKKQNNTVKAPLSLAEPF